MKNFCVFELPKKAALQRTSFPAVLEAVPFTKAFESKENKCVIQNVRYSRKFYA